MQVGFTYQTDENLTMGFDILPKGDYKVRIVECSYEPTKDSLGTNFKFKYTVQEGPHKNRNIFDTAAWTWDASHQSAVDFGHRKFNNILLSIGKNHFDGDTDEFIGGEMIVEVGINEYGPEGNKKQSNQVNKYKSISATSAPSAPLTNPSQQPASYVARPFGASNVSNPFGNR